MKKWIATFLIHLIPFSLMALPLGNPLEPSLLTKTVFSSYVVPPLNDPRFCDVWGLKIGYYGDYVWNRHMGISHNENPTLSGKQKIQVETDALLVSLNFWNRFDLFCTLGGTEILFDIPEGSFDPGTIVGLRRQVTLITNTDFAWSCGFRATLLEWGCFGLGAEVQYAQGSPRLFSFHVEVFDFEPLEMRPDGHINYHEWQAGIGAAYRIRIPGRCVSLVPYAGIKWSHAVMKASQPIIPLTPAITFNLSNLENTRDFGGAVGLTLVGCSRASLSVEGRFYDESAIHIDFHFRF